MIVLIIDENCVLAFKLERQTPVSADADGQFSLSAPVRGCSFHPGAFMSPGRLALSRANSCKRSLPACFG